MGFCIWSLLSLRHVSLGGKLLERDFSVALKVLIMTLESQDVPH